ncbi:MAG: hypothetical protein IJ801_05285 [Lachnospiraceae bacterium]|nr:hypothetical protein [Lachnospiraceae bacterium]
MIYIIIILLALLCIASYFIVPVWAFGIFIAVWLIWSLFALTVMRKSGGAEDSVFSKMKKNDKGHIFGKYISSFVTQDRWLLERTAILRDFSPEYLDLAQNLQDAMDANFEKANTYMRACDYHDDISKQNYRNKIDVLYQNNCQIIEKINALIGQLAEIENTADEVNMERVDDILASLKEITNR